MVAPGNRVLERMQDRLLAAIASGPSLNCRPPNGRQRMHCAQLQKLNDGTAASALRALLERSEVRREARIPRPPTLKTADGRSPTFAQDTPPANPWIAARDAGSSSET